MIVGRLPVVNMFNISTPIKSALVGQLLLLADCKLVYWVWASSQFEGLKAHTHWNDLQSADGNSRYVGTGLKGRCVSLVKMS